MNIPEDAKKTSNSSELVEKEEIKGTPFTIIGMDKKYFLTLGDYRFTEAMTSKEEVIKYMETNMWDLVLQTIIVHHKIEMRKAAQEFDKIMEEKQTDPESLDRTVNQH